MFDEFDSYRSSAIDLDVIQVTFRQEEAKND